MPEYKLIPEQKRIIPRYKPSLKGFVWFSFSIFLISLLISGGLFLYKGYLKKQIVVYNSSFEKLKSKIVEDMKKNPYVDAQGNKWTYGEFFWPGFNKYAYNNSNAMRFFPKTKEQALGEGYTWNDEPSPVYITTIQSSALPDTISETTEEVLNEVVECAICKRGYKVVKGELDLLRKMNLPVPHECPKCRENKRFDRMTKPKLYHRTCNKCSVPIYTPYAPDDPRIVYCVKDYQALFV